MKKSTPIQNQKESPPSMPFPSSNSSNAWKIIFPRPPLPPFSTIPTSRMTLLIQLPDIFVVPPEEDQEGNEKRRCIWDSKVDAISVDVWNTDDYISLTKGPDWIGLAETFKGIRDAHKDLPQFRRMSHDEIALGSIVLPRPKISSLTSSTSSSSSSSGSSFTFMPTSGRSPFMSDFSSSSSSSSSSSRSPFLDSISEDDEREARTPVDAADKLSVPSKNVTRRLVRDTRKKSSISTPLSDPAAHTPHSPKAHSNVARGYHHHMSSPSLEEVVIKEVPVVKKASVFVSDRSPSREDHVRKRANSFHSWVDSPTRTGMTPMAALSLLEDVVKASVERRSEEVAYKKSSFPPKNVTVRLVERMNESDHVDAKDVPLPLSPTTTTSTSTSRDFVLLTPPRATSSSSSSSFLQVPSNTWKAPVEPPVTPASSKGLSRPFSMLFSRSQTPRASKTKDIPKKKKKSTPPPASATKKIPSSKSRPSPSPSEEQINLEFHKKNFARRQNIDVPHHPIIINGRPLTTTTTATATNASTPSRTFKPPQRTPVPIPILPDLAFEAFDSNFITQVKYPTRAPTRKWSTRRLQRTGSKTRTKKKCSVRSKGGAALKKAPPTRSLPPIPSDADGEDECREGEFIEQPLNGLTFKDRFDFGSMLAVNGRQAGVLARGKTPLTLDINVGAGLGLDFGVGVDSQAWGLSPNVVTPHPKQSFYV